MRLTALLLTTIVALIAPATAFGCSIAAEPPLRPHIAFEDLRFRHVHEGERGAWVRSTSWVATPVYLHRQVQLRQMRHPVTAAFAQQRSLALLIVRQGAGRYWDPSDDDATCALAGQPIWSEPKLLVRETERAVFMTAISRRTQGDTTGCGHAVGSCDDLNFRTTWLDAPIGSRQLYAVTFD